MKRYFSFLGTSKYLNTRYSFENKVSDEVEFVQIVIQKYIIDKENHDIKTTIFMTEKAKEKNWDKGLSKHMHDICDLRIIPEGNSETEIWEIFKIIFDELDNNDDVYIDITHGFRSLPLLSIVLINYAKSIKNINIKGVYYGAWEARDHKTDIAPIFDLTSFTHIQEWANASNIFLKMGNSDLICELAHRELIPIIKRNDENKNTAINLRKIADLLKRFSNNINSPNGVRIKQNEEVSKILNMIHFEELELLPAFSPIIKKIEGELKKYKNNDILNGFIAVDWCIKNNLIQQGYTILQEFIISYVAIRNNKDHLDKDIRADIISSIKICNMKWPESEWKVNDIHFVNDIKDSCFVKIISKLFDKLSDRRNQLNHANFRKQFNSGIDYQKELSEINKSVKEIIDTDYAD